MMCSGSDLRFLSFATSRDRHRLGYRFGGMESGHPNGPTDTLIFSPATATEREPINRLGNLGLIG